MTHTSFGVYTSCYQQKPYKQTSTISLVRKKSLREKTVKTLRSKSIAFSIVSILVLTAAMFTTLPITSARTIDVWIYIHLAPNPTGLGQGTTLMTWVSQNTPTALGQLGERWENITITVTKPDGAVETLGPYKADPVGFVATFYTPDQLGTYTFQSHFPGQTLASGDFYPAADSIVLDLVVQEDKVEPEEGVPFTDDYWERPIYAENRDWWPKTGNWLMPGVETTFRFFDQGCAYAPNNDGPDSSHIMWTRPITDGGLIGGEEYGSASFYTGMSYEMKLSTMIVINGKYYYNRMPTGQGPGYIVLDLRTGEELWRNEEDSISIGQIYQFESPNQHGGQPYLWSLGGTYKMYDAFTGEFILEIEKIKNDELLFALFSDRTDNLVELRNQLREIKDQFLNKFDLNLLTDNFDGEISKFLDFEHNIDSIMETGNQLVSEDVKKDLMGIFNELHTFSSFVVSSALLTQTGRVIVSSLEPNILSEIIRLLEGRFISGNFRVNELISLENFGVLSLVGIDEHFISVIQFKSNCPFETGLVISKRFSNRIQKLIF